MTSEQKPISADAIPTGLNADVAALASLLAATNGAADPDCELNNNDLAALLRQLDQANGIASGVENRLDGLIGALDELLGGLEPDEADTKEPAEGKQVEEPAGTKNEQTQ